MANFFFTVVCDSAEQKEELMKRMGIAAYEEFIGAHALSRLNGGDV